MDYKEMAEKFGAMKHYDEHVECLSEHLSQYFNDDDIKVFHEVISADFHLDVYFIKPADKKYNVLITSGMSLLAMNVPETISDKDDYQFAELMLLLPKDVELAEVYTTNEKNGWIISMLKETARFPHHYNTWLGIGHTLQSTADLQPYDKNTEFVGCVILPSATFDENFTELKCGNNLINIYSLFPLYKNELEYKLQNGFNAFFDLLVKADANEVFNNNRENLLEK